MKLIFAFPPIFAFRAVPALGMMLLVAASAPIDALVVGFPDLAYGAGETSGKGCASVRARTPDEIAPPWHDRVTNITVTCEAEPGVDREPDASVTQTADVKPGAAVFHGVPVLAIRKKTAWHSGDDQFVLAGRYRVLSRKLGQGIRDHCLKGWRENGSTTDWCALKADPVHGGIFVETGELGGAWLHPDPDNPDQTIYASAWSE